MDSSETTWHERATARLSEARKKNRRLGSTKTRSGCVTCKARRVKCDEQQPRCKRCILAGRSCGGYAQSPTQSESPASSAPTDLEEHPTHLVGTHGSFIVEHPLPYFAGLQQIEKRKLDFFVAAAAPQLGGVLDKDFWCNQLIQVSQCEPLVLDSILAISTLYEHPQFMASFYNDPNSPRAHTPSSPRPLDVAHSQALMLYNRAIGNFKQHIVNGTATPLLALMSCSLFFCIELIRDNIYAALDLYTRGGDLLNRYLRDPTNDQSNLVLQKIRLMFGRIGTWAPAFTHRESFTDIMPPVRAKEDACFGSIAEARTSLFALMSSGNIFVRDSLEWKATSIKQGLAHGDSWGALEDSTNEAEYSRHFEAMYGVTFRMITKSQIPGEGRVQSIPLTRYHMQSMGADHDDGTNSTGAGIAVSSGAVDGSSESILPSLIAKQAQLLENLQLWLHGFQDLSKQVESLIDPTMSHLLIYFYASYIWLSTRLQLTETSYDTFTPEFEQLLKHAEVYLDSLPTPAPTFTIEIGAVPALFLVATKCRVPSLRRRAIFLMSKAPRKECMHGAHSTAEFARRLIEIEEEGLGLPIPDLYSLPIEVNDNLIPSDEMRIYNTQLMHNPDDGTYELGIQRHKVTDGYIHVDVTVVSL